MSKGRHSSAKRSYVTGKIAGRYHAQGKTWEEAEYIALSVTRRQKKEGVWKSGKGSRNAYKKGYAIGHIVRCPECGAEMVLRDGPYGEFYGCSRFPRCKGTRNV